MLPALLAPLHATVPSRFKDAVRARIDSTYAVVVFANGSKTVVPLPSLSDAERAWLTALSAEKPLPRGKSEIKVVKETPKVKQTIQTNTVVGPLETVQLNPPSVPHNQLGATCMLYGRVHWLDIAGYSVDMAAIYKVSNGADPDKPWTNPRYLQGLTNLFTSFTPAPVLHRVPRHEEDPFEWARGELRKGRPILAAFPKEIWQALPPGFVASRPWSGGDVGHQVVINGFTWNKETKQGTFHIINSWSELPEFDLKTEAAMGGAMIVERSLSPRGEPPPQTATETVQAIRLVRSVGKTNLYEVETNLGQRRIAATSEDAARAIVEDAK
jgi:hypothetical protein